MKPGEGQLHSRVKAVWRREQRLRVTAGALDFLRWGLLLFLAAGLVDWLLFKGFVNLPAAGRAVMMLLVLGVALRKAWQAGWGLIRPFNATRTALQIERQKGGMESLLVTALQLAEAAQRQGTSEELCDFTCRKAEALAEDIHSKETVCFKALQRPSVLALAIVLLLGGIGMSNRPLLHAGLYRIFTPWLQVGYPTRTQLDLVGGEMVVQEGKPVRLAARVTGIVPRAARIQLRTGDNEPRDRRLMIVDGESEYKIETAYRGFEYRWTAGDARSEWQRVEVIPAPNIERAELRLEFPDYTQRPAEQVEALTVTVPETTRIQWTLSLDRPVRQATMTLAGKDPLPLTISEDGLTVTGERIATESRAYGFSWGEREHGFVFSSPNNYLQVAPDRPPSVELTAPDRNLYATLGRKLDLAFRGRDDHGVAESFVCYRIDKTKEKTVSFTAAEPIDGSEQIIDWDYRTALTKLKVGQTVTFAVELADRYPGPNGPHRARSETRRMQFLSVENYLAQMGKQKTNLLSRLRTLYREERKVHEVVLRLDQSDPVFVQSCQLEAVRQDMMRDRVNKLADEMLRLTEDLAANGVSDESITPVLVRLRADLQRIAAENVAEAANALRALASESAKPGVGNAAAKDHAVHRVDTCARELGLLVMHLGFEDAAEVMAREMHAAAQTQASLRLQTMVSDGDAARLATAQERLGKWLARLFAATPKGKESTIDDALVEFTLTRLAKRLINDGIDARLQTAAGLIREGDAAEAAKLQSGAIAELLAAEFRLLVGAEREALAKAKSLFESQQESQEALRLEIAALAGETFSQRRAELVDTQAALHRKVQLLLMPKVPARRTRLFDDIMPAPPAVADLLVTADAAMTKAASHIEAGERDAAGATQREAEAAFASLADIAKNRIAVMTQPVRVERQTFGAAETDRKLAFLAERQLGLQEKTDDAAAAGATSEHLANQETYLADAVEELHSALTDRIKRAVVPSEHSAAVPARIAEAVQSMRKAVPLLKANKPREARGHQKAAVAALADAQSLLAEHGSAILHYMGMLGFTMNGELPSPYAREIEEEQRDMFARTRKAKPDDMPALAIPQKNLVHAVNALLDAMEPVEHLIEASDTQMLFAKEDMDVAGIALAEKDELEALDAQEYIVEELEDLRDKTEALVPKLRYLLEIVRALYEAAPEGIDLREAQRRQREGISVTPLDAAAVGKEQGALKVSTEAYEKLVNEISGPGIFIGSAAHMVEAGDRLKGDPAAAAKAMAEVEAGLQADTEMLATLMKHLLRLMIDPRYPGYVPSDQVELARELLGMAAHQKRVYREINAAKPGTEKDYAPTLQAFVKACDPFIERAKLHKNPLAKGQKPTDPVPPANLHLKLVAAQGHLGDAAVSAGASDRANTLASQKKAIESLRYFICEYALKFAIMDAAPGDSAYPSDVFQELEDPMDLFVSSILLGKPPSDEKLEWEVLGKRDRAALNENFARELPLEYRAILKDYYERLAK